MKRKKLTFWVNKLYGNFGLCGKAIIKSISKIHNNFGRNRKYFIVKYLNLNKRNVWFARFKMEVKLRRRLKKDESVHHIDGNSLNDKYKNLKVMSISEHMRITNNGRKHSEDTRKRVSKNNARYWLGKHLSDETKRKLSIFNKGKCLSEETKIKMSAAHKGKHQSKETRIKISNSLKYKYNRK